MPKMRCVSCPANSTRWTTGQDYDFEDYNEGLYRVKDNREFTCYVSKDSLRFIVDYLTNGYGLEDPIYAHFKIVGQE